MKFIFLHGAPGVGKFTVAKEIQKLVKATLFHNHLTIDVARSIFEFGTDPFWKLVRELRFQCIEAAAKENINTFIFTACYSHPEDYHYVEKIENILDKNKGNLFPVFLKCEQKTLECRVVAEHRKQMRKLSDVDSLRKAVTETNFNAIPHKSCLEINTEDLSAEETAKFIINSFQLV